MKLPAIKKLVETCTLAQCAQAEQDILNGDPLRIEIEGDDEGEQLTHVLAAMEILNQVEAGKDVRTASREFFERVRRSVS